MGATYYICNREVRNIGGGTGGGVMIIQRAAKVFVFAFLNVN